MTGVYTRDALYKTAKTHSKRATRLHSCESICVIYYFRTLYYVNLANAALVVIDISYLDNGVMKTPKRRFFYRLFLLVYVLANHY